MYSSTSISSSAAALLSGLLEKRKIDFTTLCARTGGDVSCLEDDGAVRNKTDMLHASNEKTGGSLLPKSS